MHLYKYLKPGNDQICKLLPCVGSYLHPAVDIDDKLVPDSPGNHVIGRSQDLANEAHDFAVRDQLGLIQIMNVQDQAGTVHRSEYPCLGPQQRPVVILGDVEALVVNVEF